MVKPIRIGVLVLMQDKLQTRQNFLTVFKTARQPVELSFYYSATRYSTRHIAPEIQAHLTALDQAHLDLLDGFIVTGSPVEQLSFEAVTYWAELGDLFDRLAQLAIPQLYVCWGAMAALHYFYQIEKYRLPEKLFGVYPQRQRTASPLLAELPPHFLAPHARYAEMNQRQIEQVATLETSATTVAGAAFLIEARPAQQTFLLSHLEYSGGDLWREYQRERAAYPQRFFKTPENDGESLATATFSWQDSQQQFYQNWVQQCVQKKITEAFS